MNDTLLRNLQKFKKDSDKNSSKNQFNLSRVIKEKNAKVKF